jgi:hypothetical protein
VASARLAREACDEVSARDPTRPRFVAGAVGPTNRTASISPNVEDPSARNVSFPELVGAYLEQVRAPPGGLLLRAPPGWVLLRAPRLACALVGCLSVSACVYLEAPARLRRGCAAVASCGSAGGSFARSGRLQFKRPPRVPPPANPITRCRHFHASTPRPHLDPSPPPLPPAACRCAALWTAARIFSWWRPSSTR